MCLEARKCVNYVSICQLENCQFTMEPIHDVIIYRRTIRFLRQCLFPPTLHIRILQNISLKFRSRI
jgi:hypothetical protein